MSQVSMSNELFRSTADTHSSQHVLTNYLSKNPLNIQFKCFRSLHTIAPAVNQVYWATQNNSLHHLMVANPGRCHNNKMGYCGNVRGNLAECGCEPLDRKKDPYIRRNYENDVIARALSIIKEQKRGSNQPFDLRIAFFSSGLLAGEQSLLFRLLEKLKNEGYKGKITVFFIDSDYASAIAKSSSIHPLLGSDFGICYEGDRNQSLEALGGRQDFQQFIDEVSGALPSTITLEGYIFGDAQDYAAAWERDPASYANDIVTGADIAPRQEELNKLYSILTGLRRQSRRVNENSITLLKVASSNNGMVVPQICKTNNVETKCNQIAQQSLFEWLFS